MQAPTHRCIALHACPCGYYGDPVKPCTCSPGIVTKYQKRISGPLHDRIDIHIEVPRVEYDKLSDQRLGEPATAIPKRVKAARQRQRERFVSINDPAEENTCRPIHCDACMQPVDMRQFWEPDDTSRALIRSEMSQLQLMVRAELLYDEGGGVVVMVHDRKDIYIGTDFIHLPPIIRP